MKTLNKPMEWLMLALLLAPLLYLAIVWDQLPAKLATHFDLDGRPNGWQERPTFALFALGVQLLVYFMLRFFAGASVFPQQQPAVYQKLRFAITLFLSGLFVWSIYINLQSTLGNGLMGVWIMVLGLLTVMGNYMTNIKRNFFVGIRTPWTLFNETVWRKTHQIAGRLWVICGLSGIVFLLLVPAEWQLGVVVTFLLIMVVVPVCYSYLIYSQEKNRIA